MKTLTLSILLLGFASSIVLSEETTLTTSDVEEVTTITTISSSESLVNDDIPLTTNDGVVDEESTFPPIVVRSENVRESKMPRFDTTYPSSSSEKPKNESTSTTTTSTIPPTEPEVASPSPSSTTDFPFHPSSLTPESVDHLEMRGREDDSDTSSEGRRHQESSTVTHPPTTIFPITKSSTTLVTSTVTTSSNEGETTLAPILHIPRDVIVPVSGEGAIMKDGGPGPDFSEEEPPKISSSLVPTESSSESSSSPSSTSSESSLESSSESSGYPPASHDDSHPFFSQTPGYWTTSSTSSMTTEPSIMPSDHDNDTDNVLAGDLKVGGTNRTRGGRLNVPQTGHGEEERQDNSIEESTTLRDCNKTSTPSIASFDASSRESRETSSSTFSRFGRVDLLISIFVICFVVCSLTVIVLIIFVYRRKGNKRLNDGRILRQVLNVDPESNVCQMTEFKCHGFLPDDWTVNPGTMTHGGHHGSGSDSIGHKTTRSMSDSYKLHRIVHPGDYRNNNFHQMPRGYLPYLLPVRSDYFDEELSFGPKFGLFGRPVDHFNVHPSRVMTPNGSIPLPLGVPGSQTRIPRPVKRTPTDSTGSQSSRM